MELTDEKANDGRSSVMTKFKQTSVANYCPNSASFYTSLSNDKPIHIEKNGSTSEWPGRTNQLIEIINQYEPRIVYTSQSDRQELSEPTTTQQEIDQSRLRDQSEQVKAQRLCLPFVLLACAFIASVANTLLLSYVIKSIQISEIGPIRGNINWDQKLQATKVELDLELASKHHLSLNSIENFESSGELKLIASQDYEREPNNVDIIDTCLSSTQNCSSSSRLKIDPKSGRLRLIVGDRLQVFLNELQSRIKHKSALIPKLLLELRANGSVWLSDTSYLDTKSSSSLLVDETLQGAQVLGCLKNPLSLQAQSGGVNASGQKELQIRARSGAIQLTVSNRLELESPKLRFISSSGLYISPQSLVYFEHPDEVTEILEGKTILESQMDGIKVDKNELQSSNVKQYVSFKRQKYKLSSKRYDEPLEAFNLVVKGDLLQIS